MGILRKNGDQVRFYSDAHQRSAFIRPSTSSADRTVVYHKYKIMKTLGVTSNADLVIIFVTQENDPDIVQEALNVGAAGYVVKTTAATDLPAALDAVLDGRQLSAVG